MFVSKVHQNFVLKLWEIVEKMKTGVDRLLLVSKMKNSSILEKYILSKSTGKWSIKHKLFIIHPNLFYRLQIRPLPK